MGNYLCRRMPQQRRARAKKLSRRELRDLDVKITFLEGLTRRDPNYIDALQILGDHYTQRGRYHRSLQVDKRLSSLQPRNPLAFYNLACSHALNGEFDLAAAALETAITLGYRDFRWLSKDPDLSGLRKHPLYRPLREKIRRMKIEIA